MALGSKRGAVEVKAHQGGSDLNLLSGIPDRSFNDVILVEDFLKSNSEVLEVWISHHQLFSTENVAASIRLPDHLKGHQV